MPKPTIGYTNLTGSTVTLTDLADSSCNPSAVKTLSDKNNFDDIISSDDLYSIIENDAAFLVIDGQTLTKEESLRIMDLYKNAKDPSVSYFIVTGARNGTSSLNRDLKDGDVLFNQAPVVCKFDCTLIGITCATDGAGTWEAHVYKDNTSASFLAVNNSEKEVSADLNIPFPQMSNIRLRQENVSGNISRPRITAWFKTKV